jgi:hypothetical protein
VPDLQTAAASSPWLATALKGSELHAGLAGEEPPSPAERTAQFTAWAKGQKLAELRAAATVLGLKDATAATRARVQKFVAASWIRRSTRRA